jgi:heme exporter protein B
MLRALSAVYRRDVALAWSGGGGAAAPLGFFIGVVALMPLAMGPDRALIAAAGPPLLWVAAALAALMTLERLFQADLEDASLDQLLIACAPMELIAATKGAALWTAIGLPMAVVGAVASLALQTPPDKAPFVGIGLAIGMAAFIGIGLVGAAVAAGVRRAGVLIAVLVLPFFAPPIIFGAAAASAASAGEPPLAGPFLFLCGLALFYAALGPIAAAAALRVQAD